MTHERRVMITPKVRRDLYFKFKSLCHSHGVTVERGLEKLMEDTLARAAVLVRDDMEELTVGS